MNTCPHCGAVNGPNLKPQYVTLSDKESGRYIGTYRLGSPLGRNQIQCAGLKDGLVHRVCYWSDTIKDGARLLASGVWHHFFNDEELLP